MSAGREGSGAPYTRFSAESWANSFILLQDFANPIANTFSYPNIAGISLSFTDSGFFEQAQCAFGSGGLGFPVLMPLLFSHLGI